MTGSIVPMCNAKSNRRGRDQIAFLFPKQLTDRFEADIPDYEPRYRIGPKGKGLILRGAGEGAIEPTMAEWSLMYGKPMKTGRRPLWTNARAEGLTETYPWRLLRSRRCLSVTDGFYEPEKPAGAQGTVPWSYYQRMPREDGSPNPFFMAGLWNEFTHSDTGEVTLTYTIITVPANDVLRVHNRMPAMIPIEDAEAAERWLFEEDWPLDVLATYANDDLEGWTVTDKARSSRVMDGAYLIEPVAGQALL